jgi:predicted MFS family arabinose efflux permease
VTRATLCGCIPAVLGAFDFGFLALAGPRVAPGLGVTGDVYPWLFSASSFAYGAAVMPTAALTAKLGPARGLAFGLAGVAAGAGTLAAASGLAVTLGARALTGVSGALAATAAIALLAAIADEDERRTAFAALGGAVALGFAAGALAAGLSEWRAVLAAVAVAALVAGLVTFRLPASSQRLVVPPLRGGAVLTIAIVCAAAGIAEADAGELWAIPLLALAGVLARTALRRAAGWLPPRRSALAAAAFAGAATTASGVGGTVLIAIALTDQHLPGALLGVFGLAVLPGSRWAGRLTAHAGAQVTAATGLAVQALGLFGAALALAGGGGALWVAVALLVFGTGHVAANAGAAAAVANLAGPRPTAVLGLLIAAQYVGGGTGALVTTAVADGREAYLGVLAAAAIAVLGALPLTVLHRASPCSPVEVRRPDASPASR